MKPGKRLSPICLTDKETCLPDYTTCVVTGWGNNDRFGGERFPSVLQDCDQYKILNIFYYYKIFLHRVKMIKLGPMLIICNVKAQHLGIS